MFCERKGKLRRMETENFRRGKLVWARAVYPHQWWPGIVLKSNFLGILVSFFDCETSRYFLPSEICSFEDKFPLLVEKCSNNVLLNRALKFSGEDVVSSLSCCGRVKQRQNASELFRPLMVLGFVHSVAVLPWVERLDFLSAVNAVAQVMAFRHYYLVSSGIQSSKQADEGSFEKMHSVAMKLDNLEMVDDWQKISENAENNLPDSATNGKKIRNFSQESLGFWNKEHLEISSMSQTKQQKIHSLQGMMVKLHILAIDPFYLAGKCLITFKSSFLSFRSLSYQSTFGNLCKKCSPIESEEAQARNAACIMSQQRIEFHGEKEKIAVAVVPYVESPVNCLGLKRQLDQSAVSEPPLKLQKTLSFSINGADAYLWRSNEEFNAVFTDTFISGNTFSGLFELFKTMPFPSIEAYAHLLRNLTGYEANLFDSFFSGSLLKLKTQNLSSVAAQSLTYMSCNSWKDLVLNLLNLSYASIQQPRESESIMKRHGACISYTEDVIEKLLQSSAAQSVSNYVVGFPAKDDETSDLIAGASEYQLNAYLFASELKLLPGNRDNSSLLKTNRDISMNEVAGCSFKEKKDFLQPFTSDLPFKSKARKQPEARTSFAVSKSLLMKFPKDCSLPSKQELVKKFSPFGRVDSFKTKVYFYTGSARVVFLHQLDAVAAYQYAKRKKITFGRENVKFWLDRFEDKRGSKELIPFPSNTENLPGFNLKSCLKKCKPLEKEDKRCLRHVRFRIES